MLAEHPHVQVLVNNVGDYRPLVRFRRSSPESWKQMYDINLFHTFAVTHAFLESMIDGGGGSIVNVHSVEGMRGYPGDPVYGAFKAANAAFTTDLAVAMGRHGIRVNGIGPDLTQTPQVDYLTGWEDAEDLWPSWAPVGRLGWPEDQARVALFLASDLSAFVTGHNVPVDGGTARRRRLVLLPDRGPLRQPPPHPLRAPPRGSNAARVGTGPGETAPAVESEEVAMGDVAEYVLERLREWGIHRVYGYPGDGINGFLGAFDRVGGDPVFTQARHEEMAAFMACAHAKFTGEIGACIATSGPGAVHLANGLYDAKLDHQPVLAIVGQQKRSSVGAHYQQEIDLQSFFKDVAGYVSTVMEGDAARHVVDRAVKSALTERRPAVVIIPEDVQEETWSEPPRAHGSVFSSVGWNQPHMVPDDELLRQAADVLNAGEKVAILVGQGAKHASREVLEVADLLGAGVAKALLGKAVVPDTSPIVTGSIGLLGTEPSNKMMMGCDTLLMVGTSFPYAEWLPPEGQARCVEIDIDGSLIGVRYPNDVSLVGDATDTLRALIPMLERKEDRTWQEMIRAEVETWWRILDDRAHQDGDPVNPQLVFYELNERLPGNCILTSDSGSATNWAARYLQIRDGMQWSLSGTLATMVPGVPYAIGAKFAHPDQPVIAFAGDGAFEMLGMNELLTVKRYQDELCGENPTLIFAVLVNEDLNQVSFEQRVLGGDPKNPATQDVPYVPAAAFARLLGFEGIKVDRPEDVGPAWDRALRADGPVLLEFVTDPQIPPLPPHVKPSMLAKTVEGLAHGDEDAVGVATKGFRGKVTEMVEHAKEALPSKDGA